jgi:RNA polymerase sigma factor (sigma-70 family)
MRMSAIGTALSVADGEETVPEAEFADFYRRHYWLVLAFAQRRLRDEETAREVAADTFRIAWSKMHQRGAYELAWLYTIARNLLGNEYRRQFREQALLRRVGDGLAAGPVQTEGNLVREALLELRDKDRDILYLTYWEELSAARLSAVLGCSEATAWKRLSRARKALQHILQQKGHTHGNS